MQVYNGWIKNPNDRMYYPIKDIIKIGGSCDGIIPYQTEIYFKNFRIFINEPVLSVIKKINNEVNK